MDKDTSGIGDEAGRQAPALALAFARAGASGPEAEAAALADLRHRLSGLTERIGGEADALSATWGLLRAHLVQGQRPWRKAQKRLLRLAGGLLGLAPRIDAVLSRSARISENIARLGAGLARNQQHFTKNQASLYILRQKLEGAKALFAEAYQAARESLAVQPEDTHARRQALEESRLLLAPLADVVRARKARLETGLARQRALAERIDAYQDELARETAAQQASGRLYRRLSRALTQLEQRLEAETRAVMAEGSRSECLVQDQRKAVREGRARLARLGADLRSADSLARRLEDSRLDLMQRLERLDEAAAPMTAQTVAPQAAQAAGPVAALGEQISELHEALSADEAADGTAAGTFGQAWLEPSGWIATALGASPPPEVRPAAENLAEIETLRARLAEQERLLETSRAREAAARAEAEASAQAVQALQQRAEGQDKLLEEYRRKLRDAEAAAQGQAARLARAARERDLAEQRAERTRLSLAYQLGDTLQRGFQGWEAFRALPGGLLALRREHLRRDEAGKTAVTLPLPEEAKQPG